MLEKIKRQVEQLEQSMAVHEEKPFDIEIAFMEPADGCPGGRIVQVVWLSELTKANREKKG